jgi:hypothetical protein
MKYFKHDLLSREDDKIWELIDSHGMQGYGIWWVILEELYKAESTGFQVEATDIWLKRLSRQLGLSDWLTMVRTLDRFAELNLIDGQLWRDRVIYAHGIAKLHRDGAYRRHRDAVFERDRYCCVYCSATEDLTLDHVIPYSKGGSDEPDNLATCCRSCNSRKHARTPQEWLGGL